MCSSDLSDEPSLDEALGIGGGKKPADAPRKDDLDRALSDAKPRDLLGAALDDMRTSASLLDGKDSGGSQFFVAVSPQPHLDGKYAVFGQVVRGMELLDLITRFDVIDRIRIWDGVSF